MMEFNIGDLVTTKKSVEALYSNMYKGTSSAYPEQWFDPGTKGIIVAKDSPSVTRNVLQYVVEFKGRVMENDSNKSNVWRVRLDPDLIEKVEKEKIELTWKEFRKLANLVSYHGLSSSGKETEYYELMRKLDYLDLRSSCNSTFVISEEV